VLETLRALAEQGDVKPAEIKKAMEKYGIHADKNDPMYS
jgi:pyruvate dehydrogenase complex dehydrogenase (E1) component